MKIAFHFRADPEEHGNVYGQAIDIAFLKKLRAFEGHELHAEIFHGDLLVTKFTKDESANEEMLRSLLGYDPRKWTTIDLKEFANALGSSAIYVVAADGLSRRIQDHLDNEFKKLSSSYLGAFEVNPADHVHRTLYYQWLPPTCRYVGRDLRLYCFDEDSKETGWASQLEQLGFRVFWENVGARFTFLDNYQSLEHAQRLAALEVYVGAHLARVADEILLRSSQLDPRLHDDLHAALSTFDFIDGPGKLAQVAISCRLFLERLADAVYPPRTEQVNGRAVGPKEYRNRLWAYVMEQQLGGAEQRVLLAQMEDLGKRIDRVDELANKGLHDRLSMVPADIHRLVIALLTVAYDVLSVAAPPLISRGDQYSEAITRFGKNVVSNRLP